MKRGTLPLLVVCLGAGLGLRLWGLEQGYPEFYGHVDEIGVAASIWNFFRSATLMPTEFTYPAFYSYLVAAGIWGTYWLGLVPEVGGCIASLVFTSFVDPAWLALVGRGISGVASALTVGFTYMLGHRAYNRRVGGAAALLTAFAVIPVKQAHMALPDSSMALLAVVCFYYSWMIYERGSWLDYAAAGIAAGLVVATKYNGAFTALAIVAAHGLRCGQRGLWKGLWDGRFWGAVGLAVVALFAGSPYLLLAHEKYLGLINYQVSSLSFSMRETTPWWWVVEGLLTAEFLVGGLMVGGMVIALWKREPLDVLFLASWLPSFLYIGSWTRESLHYFLHFYPLLALGAARLIELLVPGKRRAWKVWGLAGLCVLPNVYKVVQSDVDLTHLDTRTQATAWIEENIADGTRLAMTWLPYCPRLALKLARQSVERYYRGNSVVRQRLEQIWGEKPAYELVNLELWLKQPVVPESYRQTVDLEDSETRRVFSRGWRSPRQLRKMGVEYLVLPEAAYGRYLSGTFSAEEGSAAYYHFFKNRAYFTYLTSPESPETERLVSFSADSRGRGGPIHIYRLRP